MRLTKLFKDTVTARVERDPAFREALSQEILFAFIEGDTVLGKSLLGDLVNSINKLNGRFGCHLSTPYTQKKC